MLPEGWKETQPANIVTFFNGFAFRSTDTTDKGIKWIKITNVLPGGISWKECNYLPIDFCKEYSDFLVKKGDIVVALTRPIINNHLKIGRLENEDDLSLLNQRIAKLVPKNGNYLNYIYHLFRSDDFSNKIQKALMGTDPPNLSMSVLKRFLLPLPPLPEQKKIAAILSTWDRAIEGTETLLANSQQQKKALMQQLLTGKKRLSGFTGEWKNVLLKDIALIKKGQALSSKDLIHGDYPVIAGGKTSPYTHKHFTHENAITVSASGAYAGYVSFHSYKIWASDCSVITSRSGNSISFIYFWLSYLQNKIFSLQSGGAQPHIYPRDLELLHIHCPPLPEQQAIASVLSTADEEITSLESDLSRLRQEKKALMQQLLTGKRRVKVD